MNSHFAAANPFEDIVKGVKSSLAGTNVVIGTVEVMSPFPGMVTCFKDTPGGAISRGPISSITEAEGFPIMIVTKSGVITSGACADLQKKGLLVPAAGSASSADETGRPANFKPFADTELKGIFDRSPQPGGGKRAEWPRVAITLLEAPSWGWDKRNVHHFKFPSSGCWTFRAKVWESRKIARDIPAFHHCTDMPTVIHGGDAEMIYQVWSGITGSSMMNTAGSTGIQRTNGPNWPDTPLSVAKMDAAGYMTTVTFTGAIIYILLYDTGIDFRGEDHRVWVNLAPAVAPK